MFLSVIVLVIGFILLIKGADLFIKSATSIAKELGVSEFIIGLTLVAIGTSVPELASSLAAVAQGEPGIIMGNVIGSNSANIGLIVGLSASLFGIIVLPEIFKRDGIIMAFISILFFFLILNGNVSRIEAIIMLFLYVSYLFYLFDNKEPLKKGSYLNDFIWYCAKVKYRRTVVEKVVLLVRKLLHPFAKPDSPTPSKILNRYFLKDIAIFIISFVAIIFGADILVKKAVFFANTFGISENIIGLTLVAIGTSLPEITVSLTAARKGQGDIAIGNIIGSNIANILLILGISASITPLTVPKSTIWVTAPFMVALSILYLIFIRSEWKISKLEGGILLSTYAIFIAGTLTFLS